MDSANLCGFRLQFADSTYSCGFRDSLNLLNTFIIVRSWIPETCSGFHTFCCGFRKVACFRSNFEQYSVLAICPWNRKQQRRLKKNSSFAVSGTNLIFACCGIRSQYSKNAQFGLVRTFLVYSITSRRWNGHLSTMLVSMITGKKNIPCMQSKN